MKDDFARDLCILTHILFPIELISNVDLFYKMESVNPMIPYVIGTYCIAFSMSFVLMTIFYIVRFIIKNIRI